MDEELFVSAVFISQLRERAVIGRWPVRRRRRVRVASWHLIDAERALTSCGLDLSYRDPRRPWSEIPDDQRCQSCRGRLQRVNHAHAGQRNP
jgi:hypothetical protein